MCVHHVHELAVHGWVAPCVRRGGAGAGRAMRGRAARKRDAAYARQEISADQVFVAQVFVDFMILLRMTKTDDSSTSRFLRGSYE